MLWLPQLRCLSRRVMAWRWQRTSWRLCSTRLRKESGALTREMKSVRGSSLASTCSSHWVGQRRVDDSLLVTGEVWPCSCLTAFLFVHRCRKGILITCKSARLLSVLHCRFLPHWPQHHPQTTGEPLLQVKQHTNTTSHNISSPFIQRLDKCAILLFSLRPVSLFDSIFKVLAF